MESAQPKAVDLGVVELAYSTPSRHDLGEGVVCVLTAETVDRASIELLASVVKGKQQLGATRVLPALINRPIELSVGGYSIKLTPSIRQ